MTQDNIGCIGLFVWCLFMAFGLPVYYGSEIKSVIEWIAKGGKK